MPRKERRTNNVQKKLAKAALSAGQTKTTSTFFATSSCGRGVHGGNAATNVSVRSPNAKDIDTNSNLITGDGIANSENDMGLDFARSTCDASVSISRNTSGSNVNDFDSTLCCVFDAKNFSETDRENSRNKEERIFQKKWFDNFQWSAYNREIKKAFCKFCADLATESEKKRSPFANETLGFRSWKKGMKKLKENDASELHKKWVKKKLMLGGKDESIVSFIYDKNKKLQQLHRDGMEASFSTLKTLLRQGLAIRRRDFFGSTFYQFNKHKAKHVPDLKLLVEEKIYMSNDIVAEMEKC